MSSIEVDLPCAFCNENLRGAQSTGTCSSCGRGVDESLDFELIDFPTLTVATDVSCFGCEYNLRTLGIQAACPECARPVAHSLRPGELRFANIDWLQKVKGGVTNLLIAVLCPLGFAVLGWMASALVAGSMRDVFNIVLTISFLVFLPYMGITGVWRSTTVDPFRAPHRSAPFLRSSARLIAVVSIPLYLGVSILNPFAFSLWWPIFVPLLVLTVGLICTFAYLRHVARLNRVAGLWTLTTALMWTTGCTGTLLAVWLSLPMIQSGRMMVIATAAPAAAPGPVVFSIGSMAIAISSWSTFISLLCCYVLAVVTLIKYRILFFRAVADSPAVERVRDFRAKTAPTESPDQSTNQE